MQIKDKVLDGVGKHFVGAHGCLVRVVAVARARKQEVRSGRGNDIQTIFYPPLSKLACDVI